MPRLSIEVTAEVADAVRQLDLVGASIDGMDNEIQPASLSLTDLKSGLELAKDAARMVGEAYQATVGVFLDYAAAVRDVTTATGIQADEASRLIESSDDAGVSVSALKLAMKQMLKDGVQPSIENMAALSDEYLAIEDPTQRAQFAMDKFGRSGLEMIKWLEKGGDAMRDTAAVMDDEMAASAEDARIAIDALNDASRNIALSIGAQLTPTLAAAAKAFELLITWNNRLDAAVAQHTAEVIQSTKSYQDYRNEILRVAAIQGSEALQSVKLLTEAEWDQERATEAARIVTEQQNIATQSAAQRAEELRTAVVNYTGSMYEKLQAEKYATASSLMQQQNAIDAKNNIEIEELAVRKLSAAIGALSAGVSGTIKKEQEGYLEQTVDITTEIGKTVEAIDKLVKSNGAAYGPTKDLADQQLNLTQAQIDTEQAALKLAEAQKKLADNTDPDKMASLSLAAREAEVGLAKANDKVKDYTTAIGENTGGVINNSKKIEELRIKLEEQQAAAKAVADEHEDATKRILFGYLEQRLAISGTTQAEQDALMAVALKWGLVDQASYDAYQGVMKSADDYAASGNKDALFNNLERDRLKALGLTDALNSIPDRNVYVNVHYQKYGDENFGGAGDPNATGYAPGYFSNDVEAGLNQGAAGAMPR